MSANATGTPTTNFSLPKFNTPSNAPNGKGVNEMMDAVDALLASSFVPKVASLANHEVPVWNGSTWVRSSTTQINNNGQVLPTITTSSFASGPPGSPSDGDIWNATGVDGNGTRWAFQYSAGSASAYKWEFIGGPAARKFGSTNVAINAMTQVGVVGYYYDASGSHTTVRAGDYIVGGGIVIDPNGAAGQIFVDSFQGGSLVQGGVIDEFIVATAGHYRTFTIPGIPVTSIGAGVVIGLGTLTSNPGTNEHLQTQTLFTPVRIA